MGYLKEDIPGMIKALEAAKPFIISRTARGICYAVEQAWADGEISESDYDLTVTMIADALCEHGYLEEFIGGRRRSRTFYRELRLIWIDKMIADLKEFAK